MVVLDASIAIAWMFSDERTAWSERALSRVTSKGALVPSLWRLEIANTLRMAVRRNRCDEPFAQRCIGRLQKMTIAVDSETDAHAWGATRAIATRHDLTIYDAAYLELAIRSGLQLASNDRNLNRAAAQVGLDASRA